MGSTSHGTRAIAKAVRVSRGAVRKVVASGSSKVQPLNRPEKAERHHDDIVELLAQCQGNLVRVHEELEANGAEVSYPALTAYCRRHGIGHEPKQPAGQYDHKPGKEMQHDTSPHQAHISGREQKVQIAGLALAYSRLAYIQLYPRFTRFECKVFLDDAIDYVGGDCGVCMVDNTSVIVLHGTGADMVPVPQMAAFAEQRGFEFRAHEKGDANRSAVVEGLFNFVQNNFLAGREFHNFTEQRLRALWRNRAHRLLSLLRGLLLEPLTHTFHHPADQILADRRTAVMHPPALGRLAKHGADSEVEHPSQHLRRQLALRGQPKLKVQRVESVLASLAVVIVAPQFDFATHRPQRASAVLGLDASRLAATGARARTAVLPLHPLLHHKAQRLHMVCVAVLFHGFLRLQHLASAQPSRATPRQLLVRYVVQIRRGLL